MASQPTPGGRGRAALTISSHGNVCNRMIGHSITNISLSHTFLINAFQTMKEIILLLLRIIFFPCLSSNLTNKSIYPIPLVSVLSSPKDPQSFSGLQPFVNK